MSVAFNRAVAVELNRPVTYDPFDLGDLDNEINDLKPEMTEHEKHLLYLLKAAIEQSYRGTKPAPKVYFAQSESGQVKIGYTAGSLKSRAASLQTGSPHKIEMKAAIYGAGHSVERSLHQMFSVDRMKGEWFKASPELEKIIKDHPIKEEQNPLPCRCELCQKITLPAPEDVTF